MKKQNLQIMTLSACILFSLVPIKAEAKYAYKCTAIKTVVVEKEKRKFPLIFASDSRPNEEDPSQSIYLSGVGTEHPFLYLTSASSDQLMYQNKRWRILIDLKSNSLAKFKADENIPPAAEWHRKMSCRSNLDE